jgi:hypothetical protein
MLLDVDLNKSNLTNLRQIARELNVSGYYKMKKDELLHKMDHIDHVNYIKTSHYIQL